MVPMKLWKRIKGDNAKKIQEEKILLHKGNAGYPQSLMSAAKLFDERLLRDHRDAELLGFFVLS